MTTTQEQEARDFEQRAAVARQQGNEALARQLEEQARRVRAVKRAA